MAQQLNEMINSNTHKNTAVQETTLMFQPTEILRSQDGMFLSSQMASNGDEIKSRGPDDGEASVSLKLELHDRDIGQNESDDSSALPNSMGVTEKSNQLKIKSEDDNTILKEDKECRVVDHDRGSDDESLAYGGDRARAMRDSDHARKEGILYPVRGIVSERKRGRPRGRKSGIIANSTFENKRGGTNNPNRSSFGDVPFATSKFDDAGRGVFVERRKRGRPRGSRGSRGANSSFEMKSPNEICGSAMDYGSPEVGIMSSTGVPMYETPPSVVKVGRGALRPGCKSYRGRASGTGRGYRMEYHDQTSSWEGDTGFVPVEYDSALSDLEMPGKKRGRPPVLTPPLPKRARGVRGRPRGRSRGRIRTSVDRSVDSDSSDFGTQRFETPEHGTSVFDSPDITESRSGSEVDAPVSERFTGRRRGGRRPRGGRASASFDPEEASDSMSEERIVTCAICKETMNQAMFTYHKLRKHNNCTWREGIDTPLDLNDSRVVNALLKQALQKRKQLVCEQCGLSRSSLVGYQSHVTFCAKSEGERDALLETCPVCNRRMMPSSLKVHMGVHRQEERAKIVEKDEGTPQVEIDPGEGSSKSSGKTKRAAANRAVSLMQQVIRGEDIFIEKTGDSKVSSSKDMFELYEEKIKSPDEEGTSGENGTKEIVVSIYQIAAWVRTIHRYGKASCRNPGCSFKSSDKDELISHFKSCELRPIINYLCKLCSFGCELEKDMQNHVKSLHMEESNKSDEEFPSESDDSEDMEEIDEDEEIIKRDNSKKGTFDSKETTPAGKTPKYYKHVYFLSKQNVGRVDGLHAYITTLNWTLDFQLENYSHIPLYADWRTTSTDWLFLGEKEAEPYLPKARTSLNFSRMEIESELYDPSSKVKSSKQISWLQLSLFESRIESKSHPDTKHTPGFITLFAGGPVWAQAWCPTSLFVDCHGDKNESNMDHQVPVSQFMAVSCNQDFDTYHPIGNNNKGEKGLIQIWDFGPLTNEENERIVAPYMSLGIAHEYGSIWALEWCPSGCYDEEGCESNAGNVNGSDSKTQSKEGGRFLRRLGLLAAACGDGTIRIFSVPFPSELNAQEPVSDLQLDLEMSENSDSERNANQVGVDGVHKQSEIKADISSSNEKLNDDGEIEVMGQSLLPLQTEIKSPARSKDNRTVNDLSAFETPVSSRTPCVISSPKHSSEIESESKTKKTKPYPIYKPSFVVTLMLDSTVDSTEDKNQWQCLRIAWSLLGKSHRILAASFTNGMVALWDLNSTSPLLRSLKKNSDGVESLILRPYHVFLAHTNAVTALALVPCGTEKREDTGDSYPRYLVTGARDRMLKIWDLHDTTAPVTTFPRGLISNVVWLTNWLSCAVSNDDGFTRGRSATKIQSLRQYGYKPCPLLLQNSPVMSVAHSDWLNGIAHGTYGGEACFLIAQQLLLTLESLKTLKTRRAMIFYSELIDFMAEGEENRNAKPENSQSKVDSEPKNQTVESIDEVLSEEEKEENSEKESKSSEKTTEAKQNDNCDDQACDLPRTYAEASKRYGLLFCDLAVDHETGKMPKEASLRLQHLEEMKNVPLNLYPVAAINRICWNPNLQSFIWLATGHQTGFVRVCRIQKTRSNHVEKFESRSARKVAEVYSKRMDCDGQL